MEINIGIAEQDRAAIAEGLSRLLADTYTLYLKTHNFHWNVTGPMFNTLHLMFEGQYTELAWPSTPLPNVFALWASRHRAPTPRTLACRRSRKKKACPRQKT